MSPGSTSFEWPFSAHTSHVIWQNIVVALAMKAAFLALTLAGTVGVIAPPSRIAAVEQALAALDDPRLVAVTPLQAKGLEYDGVIVVAPDDIVAESPGGVRVLYVALTRPTQRLVTVDPDPARADWRESLRWPAND